MRLLNDADAKIAVNIQMRDFSLVVLLCHCAVAVAMLAVVVCVFLFCCSKMT